MAHTTMEAEKFHNLPSASWRLRKASVVSKDWRMRGAGGISLISRAREDE